MSVFLFRVLPIFALLLLIAGVVLISRGISRASRKTRFFGMGSAALSMLVFAYVCVSAFARL